MRSIIFALALALLVSSVFAKPPELQALASVTSFEGWNCNPTGGPYTFTATIYIANPYNGTMTVNYTYYDYYAGRETDGGRVCMIQANNEDHCSFTIPVTLGGEAAGNASMSVKLFASIDGVSEQPEKRIDYSFTHAPASTETNSLASIAATQARLDGENVALSSACTANGVCCGMAGPQEKLSAAGSSLALARELVRQCKFSDATTTTAAASADINGANSTYHSTFRQCQSALNNYAFAYGNLTRANETLLKRAACGMNVSASRTELANSERLLAQGADRIEADAYSDAVLYLEQSLETTNVTFTLSNDCPLAGLGSAGNVTGPSQSQTPPPQQAPGEDPLSKVIGALGYIVIAAIIIVVGAAIYVSLGKRHLEGMISRGPRSGAEHPGAPPSPGAEPSEELPPIDHTKVEEEFQEWLKKSEAAEEAPTEKHEKRGKKK